MITGSSSGSKGGAVAMKQVPPGPNSVITGGANGTAVRIQSISAAQNKRGKDCFEGGMGTGSFTWFKDMGGQSNWLYATVSNCTEDEMVELALWLLYEASTEPLVDPLTPQTIQVGFFNQSKCANRQVPLFELAEESLSSLELQPGHSATLKFRINDLSSHHQNQRFIIVVGPSDAPIRGSRSVPIEIMSKPRAPDNNDIKSSMSMSESNPSLLDLNTPAAAASKPGILLPPPNVLSTNGESFTAPPIPMVPAGLKRPIAPSPVTEVDNGPDARKRWRGIAGVDLSTLVAVTDPHPSPERQVDLIITMLEALQRKHALELYYRLGERLGVGKRPRPANSQENNNVSSLNGESEDDNSHRNHHQSSNGAAPSRPNEDDAVMTRSAEEEEERLAPLVKAILLFKQNNAFKDLRSAEAAKWLTSILDKIPSDLTDSQLEALFLQTTAT